jgi:hypothetical protein
MIHARRECPVRDMRRGIKRELAMAKQTKNAVSSPARKGSKKAVVVETPTAAPVSNAAKSPEQIAKEVKSLLADLHAATNKGQKRSIRRKLRARKYFISESGGGLARHVPATAAAETATV